MKPDREPPAALDAERAALGAVLIKPTAFAEVALDLRTGDFYLPAHRAIFEAMAALDRRRQPVDIVALAEELKAAGVLSRMDGGADYLVGLARSTPTAENVGHYVGLVRRAAAFRAAVDLGARLTAMGYAASGDPSDMLEEAGRGLVEIVTGRRTGLVRLGDGLDRVMEAIEGRSQGKRTGLATGFWEWDDLTAGLAPETFNVIAARPSVGKTSWLRCICRNVAAVGAHVLVFSLEESADQMREKWLVGETNVDNRNVRRGRLYDDEWRKIHASAAFLHDLPIYIDDADGRENNLERIRLKARAHRAANPDVDLVVALDYLQLAEPGGGAMSDSRAQAVAAISRGFKALVKETKAVGLALAQLNREVEKNNRAPLMSDLRESGAIEQDADSITFLHADMDAPTPAKIAELGELDAILAKNRGGPTGTFKLRWLAKHGRFESHDPAPVDPQDALPGM